MVWKVEVFVSFGFSFHTIISSSSSSSYLFFLSFFLFSFTRFRVSIDLRPASFHKLLEIIPACKDKTTKASFRFSPNLRVLEVSLCREIFYFCSIRVFTDLLVKKRNNNNTNTNKDFLLIMFSQMYLEKCLVISCVA